MAHALPWAIVTLDLKDDVMDAACGRTILEIKGVTKVFGAVLALNRLRRAVAW